MGGLCARGGLGRGRVLLGEHFRPAVLVVAAALTSACSSSELESIESVGCLRARGRQCWHEPQAELHLRVPVARFALVDAVRTPASAGGVLRLAPSDRAREVRFVDEGQQVRAQITLLPVAALPNGEDDLRACAASGDLEGWRAPRCASRLARRSLAAGDLQEAQRWVASAEPFYAQEGLDAPRLSDLLALAFHALWRHDELQLARALLDRARALVATYPAGRPRWAYYDGLWSRRVGDLVGASDKLAAAEAGFQAWGLDRLALGALELWAVNAQELGRGHLALERLERARGRLASIPACAQARFESNLGWIRYLERSTGVLSTPDPRPPLERSLRLYQERCSRPRRLDNAKLNLALAALQEGRPEAAAESHTSTRAVGRAQRIWQLELTARRALSRGEREEARRAFERMGDEAGPLGAASRWRSWLGLGDVAADVSDWEPAFAAYARAEEVLEETALWLPLNEDRSAYLADRRRSLSGLVSAALALGQTQRAFCAIRRAQRRARADLATQQRISSWGEEKRRRWTQALERYLRLRRRWTEDVRLDWGRSQRELETARQRRTSEWSEVEKGLRAAVALLEDETSRLDCGGPERGGDELVAVPESGGPGRYLLRSGGRRPQVVRSVEPGDASLTVYPGPLAQLRRTLTGSASTGRRQRWSLGLGVRKAPRPGGHVVVAADPSEDLQEASREGRAIAKIYRDLGFQVTLLVGAAVTWPA